MVKAWVKGGPSCHWLPTSCYLRIARISVVFFRTSWYSVYLELCAFALFLCFVFDSLREIVFLPNWFEKLPVGRAFSLMTILVKCLQNIRNSFKFSGFIKKPGFLNTNSMFQRFWEREHSNALQSTVGQFRKLTKLNWAAMHFPALFLVRLRGGHHSFRKYSAVNYSFLKLLIKTR